MSILFPIAINKDGVLLMRGVEDYYNCELSSCKCARVFACLSCWFSIFSLASAPSIGDVGDISTLFHICTFTCIHIGCHHSYIQTYKIFLLLFSSLALALRKFLLLCLCVCMFTMQECGTCLQVGGLCHLHC